MSTASTVTTPVSPSATAGARPTALGSVTFLLLSFPLGVGWFAVLVPLIAVSVGTALVWVGLATGACTVLLWRAAALLERARVYALLNAEITPPYRPLPDGPAKQRWRTRLADGATWRDLAYLLLLLPIGIAEFVVVVTTWATSLGLLGLPIYYRYLPGGEYRFPAHVETWFVVDSVPDALPFAAAGLLALAGTIALCRGIAAAHVRFATTMLGPMAR